MLNSSLESCAASPVRLTHKDVQLQLEAGQRPRTSKYSLVPHDDGRIALRVGRVDVDLIPYSSHYYIDGVDKPTLLVLRELGDVEALESDIEDFEASGYFASSLVTPGVGLGVPTGERAWSRLGARPLRYANSESAHVAASLWSGGDYEASSRLRRFQAFLDLLAALVIHAPVDQLTPQTFGNGSLLEPSHLPIAVELGEHLYLKARGRHAALRLPLGALYGLRSVSSGELPLERLPASLRSLFTSDESNG